METRALVMRKSRKNYLGCQKLISSGWDSQLLLKGQAQQSLSSLTFKGKEPCIHEFQGTKLPQSSPVCKGRTNWLRNIGFHPPVFWLFTHHLKCIFVNLCIGMCVNTLNSFSNIEKQTEGKGEEGESRDKEQRARAMDGERQGSGERF